MSLSLLTWNSPLSPRSGQPESPRTDNRTNFNSFIASLRWKHQHCRPLRLNIDYIIAIHRIRHGQSVWNEIQVNGRDRMNFNSLLSLTLIVTFLIWTLTTHITQFTSSCNKVLSKHYKQLLSTLRELFTMEVSLQDGDFIRNRVNRNNWNVWVLHHNARLSVRIMEENSGKYREEHRS